MPRHVGLVTVPVDVTVCFVDTVVGRTTQAVPPASVGNGGPACEKGELSVRTFAAIVVTHAHTVCDAHTVNTLSATAVEENARMQSSVHFFSLHCCSKFN